MGGGGSSDSKRWWMEQELWLYQRESGRMEEGLSSAVMLWLVGHVVPRVCTLRRVRGVASLWRTPMVTFFPVFLVLLWFRLDRAVLESVGNAVRKCELDKSSTKLCSA